MTNVLVRGLSDEAVSRIDAEASELGLSRNEYLRRKLEGSVSRSPAAVVSDADWQRSAAVFADLDDPSIMGAAWR